MKTLKWLFLVCFLFPSCAEQVYIPDTAADKMIAYHDPYYKWPTFQGIFETELTYADSSVKVATVSIDNTNQFFELKEEDSLVNKVLSLKGDSCSLLLNGSTSFSQEEAEKYKLTCDRARWIRNYYTYLLGLPMKLNDPGTQITDSVEQVSFKGNRYNRIKVTYSEEVGSDTWFYYSNPETNQVEVVQFFHDLDKGDGEYILLKDIVTFGSVRFPRKRDWYTNLNDQYLGSDKILTIKPL